MSGPDPAQGRGRRVRPEGGGVDHPGRPAAQVQPRGRRREDYFATEADGADPLGGVENRLVITQALAELPPRQRACVVLRYFDELSVDETAAALNCRPGTVKSQTMRALDKLRTHPAILEISTFAGLR